MPWPNRIRDGQYAVGERQLQLPLTEPARHNASHGLVRWAAWSLEEHTGRSVSLRLPADGAERLPVDARPARRLRPVRGRADGDPDAPPTSAADPAPYAQGAHPYLTVGAGPVRRLGADPAGRDAVAVRPERKLPTGREPVDGTDVRLPGGATGARAPCIDDAFTDLVRDAAGRATVELRDPGVRRRGGAVGGRRAPVADGLHAPTTRPPAAPPRRWPSSR